MYDKKRLIEIYDKNAVRRNNTKIGDFKINEIESFTRMLNDENSKTVLDLGCGTGELAQIFKDRGFNVTGSDLSEKMLEFTKQKGVDTIKIDCYDIDKSGIIFDAIFSMNCLLHIPMKDINTILSKIKLIMKNHGLFYLGLWAGNDFEGIYEGDEYEDKRFFVFYSQKTLVDIVMEHFRMEYYRLIKVSERASFHSLILRNE